MDAASGEQLEPGFHGATAADLENAAQLAAAAFPEYRALARGKRAGFLRQIASNLEGLGDALIHRVMAESALPEGRVRGELARTCGQFRFFAGIAEEGSWVDARLDLADPDRKPFPAPICVRCCGRLDRWRSSAPAIFRWRFRWPAATPRPHWPPDVP